jgi:hypothetical protein
LAHDDFIDVVLRERACRRKRNITKIAAMEQSGDLGGKKDGNKGQRGKPVRLTT